MSQTLIFLPLDGDKYITLPRADKSIKHFATSNCSQEITAPLPCAAALLRALVLLISGAFIRRDKKAATVGSAAGALVGWETAGSEPFGHILRPRQPDSQKCLVELSPPSAPSGAALEREDNPLLTSGHFQQSH